MQLLMCDSQNTQYYNQMNFELAKLSTHNSNSDFVFIFHFLTVLSELEHIYAT